MTCQYCGTQLCQCLNQGMNQAQLQNQLANQQGYIATNPTITSIISKPPFPTYKEPTPEEKFLALIDSKSDEEIVIAFETEYKKIEDEELALLEIRRLNLQDSLKAKKDSFLSMCKRFRPSINEDFIKRICGLKAFW